MPSVLITGTSSGIGQATAVELAKRKWRVFATMRDTGKSARLQDALTAAGARDQVEIVRLDVNDATSVRDIVTSTLASTGGRLDALVHNAGVAVGGAFEDVPEVTQRAVMETNFFAVLALTRALLPTFRAQKRGRIIIVSSDAAFYGQPANAIYTASKWAIEGWAESMMYELELFGIQLALIEPGPYCTNIWEVSPRIAPAGSPYAGWAQRVFKAADRHTEDMARDPAEVGIAIARALEARRMPFRRPVGPLGRLNHIVHGKVPSRLLRAGMRLYLRLPRR
jgi:NAD(P)-dependent dehydrogenase (short-subunit alcohol dehydrogenase family)